MNRINSVPLSKIFRGGLVRLNFSSINDCTRLFGQDGRILIH